MSDTVSHPRNPTPSPTQSETPSVRAELPASSTAARNAGPRLTADQPTIITGVPPIPAPAASDSTCRILEGRVVPGDRIGHFDLVEFVGGGGMGRVFRAIDTQLGRTVALKILPPGQAGDDAVQRFQNEAQSAARLDHDNIARVYYVGEDRGLSYIAFEFVEGINVRLLVERKGPLPLAEAISYTLQVTEALAHADARGVVHRDIKPSNVLITPEGRVKLIDMGLARLRNNDAAGADLTQSGVTLGTFDYISPEQARDPRGADVRSDIYSLGCTLFFMLAGRPPFPEGTVLQKLLQHQGDQAPDIREFRPDLPEDASRLLRKMMAKDPRDRQAGTAELATELIALADQIGLRPMSPSSRVWLTPPERSVSFFERHLPWMAPVAALICIVLLLDRFSAPRDELPLPPVDVASQEVADSLPERTPPKMTLPEKTLPDAFTPKKTPSALFDQPPLRKETPPQSPLNPMASEKWFSSPFETAASEIPGRGVPGRSADSPLKKGDAAKTTKTATPEGAGDSVKPSVASAATRSDVLVVAENPSGENEYASLGAACAAARNGDVVELRFNGPREERPLKISNLRVTVRPGEGFQPVVVFRPTEINPIKYPRSMVTLTAGRLTMIDVAMELRVPREVPADRWSLFETWGGQTLRLERCVLTVQNVSDQLATYHEEVAFVRARPALDADVAVESAPAATPLTTIELTDCVARGEAVFLCVEDLQPVYLLWDNGLLATTEQLLSAGGGQTASKPDEMLRLELRHLTAVARGGLCRLSATPASPFQLTVQFVCMDDIFMTSPGVPLVEQEGSASVEKLRRRFVWNGDRDFYPDVNVFWTVRSVDTETAPEAMTFEGWKTYWGASRENQPSRDRLYWRRGPNAEQPLHAHTAADYTLEDPTFGDASVGPPGFRVDRLPPPPSELFSERPRPATQSSADGNAMKERRNDG